MSIFDKKTTDLIQAWNQNLKTPVTMTLFQTGCEEDTQFTTISNELKNLADKITIKNEKRENPQKSLDLPGFSLKENIVFSAFPLQKELDPFLYALSLIGGSPITLPDEVKKNLEEINVPVKLKLYIALACPHCPAMVKEVIPLALFCEKIHLDIIDGSLFTQKAGQDKVMSAPCLILDDNFRWTQKVDNQEIVKMITQRDPSQLGEETLKTILEQGDAEWIVDQMIEKGAIFENFYKLMLHKTWSVRLGAMVVVEELCEKDPGLGASMCPVLIRHFNEHDITVQGDILYALGESGTLETIEWIKASLPSFTHQELLDAALDALETLESKTM